ncbi:hypothetical protein CRG98_003931 [Punica granatum]|uniref:RecF/RecN/SMC N-terminal domain-containing protein n=1 Tax=Punica granatum TaxID=22663 RepID=A0A2I0L4N4_PUNGR|nr:hypothetical protein CRG98_003931 [Punica granatum]
MELPRDSPASKSRSPQARPSKGKGSPRLFIREMVMRNFKSYAGEQRVGPLHKSFSAVVGPNGSGKGNVIDAMPFEFGERAKQMRLNKVSELIHNSTNHQNPTVPVFPFTSRKSLICLRNNMFKLADRLVGIYKTDNCTKSITINPGSYVVCEKAT